MMTTFPATLVALCVGCATNDAFLGAEVAQDSGADAVVVGDGGSVDVATPDAVVACDGGQGDCGGVCVSFTTDAKNCGGCGIDCGTHTCATGVCQKYIVLATSQNGARGIAVDSTTVYWTAEDDDTVMKIPIGGGTPTVLSPGQSDPYAVTVDGAFAYWTNVGNTTIAKAPIGGGATTLVTSDVTVQQSIALDATNIYWAGGGKIMKVPKTGGGAVLVADAPGATNLAVQGAWIYFTAAPIGTAIVERVPITGGAPTQLATSGGAFPLGVVADDVSVYWADGDSVLSAPIGGGTPLTIASAFGVYHTVVDATSIYWSTGFTVMKAPLGGGAAVTVANCQPSGCLPLDLAIDATSIYWTSTTSSEVFQSPK